jgi:hypothetical protein
MEQGFIDAFGEAFRPHRTQAGSGQAQDVAGSAGARLRDLLDEGIKLRSNWEQHGRMVADLPASPPAIRRRQSAK